MEEELNLDNSLLMSDIFSDIPSIRKGLELVGVKHPTYIQSSLLTSRSEVEHLSLVAPDGAGKLMAVLLYALRKVLTAESKHLLILVPSKSLAERSSRLVNQLIQVQAVNLCLADKKAAQVQQSKSVIISTPTQAEGLPKQVKDQISHMVIIEFDMLVFMGYWQSIKRLFGSIKASVFLTAKSECPQLTELKKSYMKKVLNLQISGEDQEVDKEKEEGQINHFFYVGQNFGMFSALYITLKFGMVHPKTIVLCRNTKQVYKVYLFLERCMIKNIGLYNAENPIDVKFYWLSLWLTGHINILVASPEVFSDIDSDVFKSNSMRTYKKPRLQLKSLSSIITMGVDYMDQGNYKYLFQHFGPKSLIITLADQKQVESLNSLFQYQKDNYSTVKIKPFPITNTEVQGFVYRIKDLVIHLGNKRVEWFMEMDLKKKLIKSKDLSDYFTKHPEEKSLLVKQLNDLTSKLNYGRIQLSNEVPPYLVPQILKEAYTNKVEQEIRQELKKPTESISQKIKKVVNQIDQDDENPDVTDFSRLKLISNRKRWKLRHGFKLRKRNLKNEKKGIFV